MDVCCSKLTKKWFNLTVIAAAIFYLAWTILVVFLSDRTDDFRTYLIAAYGFSHGANMYLSPDLFLEIGKQIGLMDHGGHYWYSLFPAILVWPLTFLPYQLAAAIWVFASGLAALGAAVILGLQADKLWKRILIVATVVFFVPILSTMRFGQVNTFVLLATSGAIYAWGRYRERLGGSLLATSLWLKPFSLPLVALMFWRKRLRTLTWLFIASLVVVLVGALAFGLGPALDQFAAPSQRLGWGSFEPEPDNQNLNGLIGRWLTPNEFVSAPLVNASPIAIDIYWIAAAALALASLGVLWPIGTGKQAIALEAALLTSLAHLVSPLTEYFHLTMIFIGIALLIDAWRDWRSSKWSILALTIAYIFIDAEGLVLASLSGTLFSIPMITNPGWMSLFLDLAIWAQMII
jgi:hypothetical protein